MPVSSFDRSPSATSAATPAAAQTPAAPSLPGLAVGPHGLWHDLSQMLLRHRARVAGAILFLVLAKLASVAVPLLLKRIVDTLSRPETVQVLPLALLGGYAILRFMGTLLTEMRDLLFSRVTQRAIADYALGVFNHLHRLGARFHAQRRIGALLPEIDRGTTGIAFLLGVGLFTVLPTLIEIGLVLGIIVSRYRWWYGVIIACTFMLYAGFTVIFTARRALFQRRVNRLDTYAKSRLADSLLNADAIKQFTGEAHESRRFAAIMQRWSSAARVNQRALFSLYVGQIAVIAFGVASVMLAAGQDVVMQRMTVGDLILINAFMLQLCLPLNTLGFVYREARDALNHADKLFKLLNLQPEISTAPGAAPLHVDAAEVVFDGVGFRYEAGRPILCDVAFTIGRGQTLAVVGGSGSGKSTIARLLLRFYDVDAGRILIDGQDVRDVDLHSLREAIGVVPQDAALFNNSIAANIGYGRTGATRTEIVAAARAAQLHDFIQSLPQQYDTPVGERGVMLSGGEKQRIAIARAILKDPPILIFDEATSALDARSELAIQSALDQLAQGRTTLIIAHRLSTIVGADAIMVLDGGRVAELGTHASLLRSGGRYAQLWRLQQRMEALEKDADSAA